MYVKDESLGWAVRPGFGADGAFSFSYLDTKGRKTKTPAGVMIQPEGLFFPKAPVINRFKLLGSEVRKELNKRINVEMETTWVRIEDQKPNKKGTVYELPSPLSEERINDFLQFDRTAILSLEALGMSGKEFKVEENTPFALPPDSKEKDYLLRRSLLNPSPWNILMPKGIERPWTSTRAPCPVSLNRIFKKSLSKPRKHRQKPSAYHAKNAYVSIESHRRRADGRGIHHASYHHRGECRRRWL